MRRLVALGAIAVLFSGCSDNEPAPEARPSAELRPGLYEATWTVDSLRSTDKTEPATPLAVSATGNARACIAQDGAIDPALFAEGKDQCSATSSYVRGGRISLQLDCRRPDEPGQIFQSVNARATEGGIEGEVSTTTYLSGTGDYAMSRSLAAKRIGDCPPDAPGTAPAS